MTDIEDWHVRRKRHDAFMGTDLGKLYWTYQQALIDYWRIDDKDDIAHDKLMEFDARAKEATHVFVTKLMELAGV